MTDVTSAESTNFAYDADYSLTQITSFDGSKTNYSYDAVGNVTNQTTTVKNNPFSVSYGYDGLYQLIRANFGEEGARFSYDENGNIAGIRANNDTFTNYSYNNALLLTQMQTFDPDGGSIGDFSYTYDANGNWTQVQTLSATINYTYDNLNRLTSETLPDGTLIEYAYDANGNRLTKKVTQGGNVITTNYQYGVANQLTSVGSTAYTYDLNGNMTGDGVRTYSYDAANRLTEVKEGANVIATFDYDADGRRTRMTTASGTIRFHYDGTSTRVLYETDDSGNLIARYVYGANGQLLAMVRDGQTYYYHYNGHGDVIALTDADGTVVATYQYDAFGNHIGTTGNVENPYRYAGYRWDAETGLYYLNARYYAPEIGRFITRDAFHGFEDDPASLNWYNYAHSNPVMFVDPSGHFVTGVGITYNVGGGIGAAVSILFVSDIFGHSGILITIGVGLFTPQVSISLSALFSWRRTIYHLQGIAAVIGAGVSIGPSAGLDIIIDNKGIAGLTVNLGVGVAIPIDAKAYAAKSFLIPIRRGYLPATVINLIRNMRIRTIRR
jgi:RHS repeat-associated protein